MTCRNRRSSLLLALLLAAAALPARAQLAAPKLVEDGDDAADADAPERASAPGAAIAPAPAPTPARAPASAAPQAAHGPPAAAAASGLPPPPPPPPAAAPPAADLARRVVPVSTSFSELMARWSERRAALRAQDPARARAAAAALLAAKRQLGIEDLPALAAAEVRDAARSLEANLAGDAVAHAELATALAPDLPDAHLALARARLAVAPGAPLAAAAALRDALVAAAREPHTVRAFAGDVLGAALAAVFTAAVATLLLLLVRTVRLFLHDFHDLPVLRGTAAIQSGFLALVLLGLPVAFGLGPLPILGVALLAAWLYLGTGERIVATVCLGALVALPWAAGAAARATAWTGTAAEEVFELEHGAPDDAVVGALEVRAAQGGAAPLCAALGRHHKRRGDLDAALRWYRAAAQADEHAAELSVNMGNVLFLKDDLEGAQAAYLAACDRAGADLPVLAAAHYDLSKLYLRTSEMARSAAVREKAEREGGELIRRAGSDDDFSANRYLVDVPVPERKIAALAAADRSAAAVGEWVRARVGGAIPRPLWPAAPLGFLGLLWAMALVAPRLAPARRCERCGRPACRRCDGGAGPLCGQCVNVFMKKGVVDARDRLRKEAQVRRHEQLERVSTRILAVVGGGAGHVWSGAAARGLAYLVALLFLGFVVWFWRGIMPPPQPSGYVLAGKLAVAVPLGVAVYALAVRDAFRRTRS